MSAPDHVGGRYRLLQQIGAGGMGVVWRGYDERLGRDVAVKRLPRAAGVDDEDAQLASHRAMREARITARLHHPHAVPVFDVVDHEGQPCLVMEYFPSSSLAELTAGGRQLSVAEVTRIGGEVASALAAAHRVGIVHRDVKPGNVLVAPDGAAKISDFGISHAMGDVSLTSTGLVTGTPAYLAPEVARGDAATPASDVFSLGATLYAALEGRPPFGRSENPMAMLHRVASGVVDPPVRSGPLTPLLVRMLSARPEDRPGMAEVARILTHGEPLPAPAPAASPEPADAPAAPADGTDLLESFRELEPAVPGAAPEVERRRGRRRGLLVALALAAVAAAVLAGLLARQDADPGGSPSAASSRSTPSSGTTASSSPTSSASSSPTSSPTRTPSPSSTPSPSATSRPSASSTRAVPPPAAGAPTAAALRRAVTGYYALLPGNRDAGWDRLTSRYQRTTASSRSYYESFWSAIDSVRVSDVSASAPDAVTATVTYDYEDGREYVERTRYRLVEDDGILKIDRSEVLSSVQR